MTAGGLQFLLISPLLKTKRKFAVNLLLHTLFEVFENSPWIIREIRAASPPFGDDTYVGDSLLNSFGDLIAFAYGYVVTEGLFQKHGLWAAMSFLLSSSTLFQVFYFSQN